MSATATSLNHKLTSAEEALVVSVLSHALFNYFDRTGVQGASEIGRVLKLYSTTSAIVCDDAYPPLLDTEPTVHVSCECTVNRRREVTGQQVRDEWADLKEERGVAAAFPPAVLAEYVPCELWPVIVALAKDGPDVFAQRLHNLVKQESKRDLPPTKRKPEGGKPSQALLDAHVKSALRLAKALVKIQTLKKHPARKLVAEWTSVPPIEPVYSMTGPTGSTQVHGSIPRHQNRAFLETLTDDVCRRLRMTPGDTDEIAALRRMPKHFLRVKAGLHEPLRNRAMMILLSVVGPRVESAVQINIEHVKERYRHSEGVSPAVRITPFKNKKGEIPRWKPIPYDAWLFLEVYRVYVEMIIGERKKTDSTLR